ncbi:MAG: hypothetical protein ACI8W8_002643, partial [Rhodothermales bacterium]
RSLAPADYMRLIPIYQDERLMAMLPAVSAGDDG